MGEKLLGVEETSDKNLLGICEKVLFRLIDKLEGYKPHKVEIVHGYRFSISADIRSRKLAKISGGDGKGKNFSDADIWSVYPNVGGNFSKILDNSSVNEQCHECGGSGKCDECGGSGEERCGKCGGSGKDTCSRCGGRGLEKCPNCGGTGYIEEERLRNCHVCHGSGLDQWDLQNGNRTRCGHCGGSGQDEYIVRLNCPTCGGDGKITCKKCIGKGVLGECHSCHGSGKVKCCTCSGSGKCDECGGSGRANYQLECEQKEFSHLESCVVYDSCISESSYVRKNLPKFNTANSSVMFKWKTCNVNENCASVDTIGEFGFVDNQGNERDSDSLFVSLWQNSQRNLPGDVEKNSGKGGKYRILSKSCEIAKAPLMLRFTFEMLGKEGCIYVDFAKKNWVDYKLTEIENERDNVNESSERFWKIFSYCSCSGLIAVALTLPYFFGERSIMEYLMELSRPEWIMGVAAYFLSGYAIFYFYYYVLRLAEKRRDRWRLPDSFPSLDEKERLVRLLWIFVPLVAWKALEDIVPALSSNVVMDGISNVSRNAWCYIAVMCLIKRCIVVSAIKWRWEVWIYRLLIGMLASFSIILALWPILLPEGTWLHATSGKVLGWIDLPLMYLGKVIVVPLALAVKVFGWIAGITACVVTFILKVALGIVGWILVIVKCLIS